MVEIHHLFETISPVQKEPNQLLKYSMLICLPVHQTQYFMLNIVNCNLEIFKEIQVGINEIEYSKVFLMRSATCACFTDAKQVLK